MGRFWLLLALPFAACEPFPDASTPEGAFARLAPCVDRADAVCLYNGVDRDSRWAIQTIHKALVEMRGLVERSYPAGAREGAYGNWREEAHAADAAGAFAAYCERRRCLAEVARGFGAVTGKQPKGDDTVSITTTRGATFELMWAEERWGITPFKDELQAAKLRVLDRLEQVKRNAADYDEQRRAGGSSEPGAAPEEVRDGR